MLKKKYKILSIGWHLCSTISYFENDEIKYVVSEERFSRIKNDCSFPILSINSLLKKFHIKILDLDYILIASTESPSATELIKSMSKWSVKNYLNQQTNYWYPKIYKRKNISELKVMKNWDLNNNYKKEIIRNFGFKNLDENFLKNRKLFFSKILNFPKEKIFEIDHHTCHAYYSYYASPFRNKKVLSFVMDGNGDGKNASIGIFEKNGKYKLKYFSNKCNLARLYRYITLILGMKPNEHEYKVMGLAPYGGGGKKNDYSIDIYNIFKSTMFVDGIDFKYNVRPKDYFFWFKNKLSGYRFDNIAYALQKYTQEIVFNWIGNAIRKFKISHVVFSGGVSMNVKSNGNLLKLKKLKKLFVAGAGSDESLSIGALYYFTDKIGCLNKKKSLLNLNIGCVYSLEQEKSIINRLRKNKNFSVKIIKSQQIIAENLKKGKILGRCVGKMEFGPRSLGNRAILADPFIPGIVEKINSAVKNRDFWMPFAPIILINLPINI